MTIGFKKSGKVFCVGDDIDTDQLAPGSFMRGTIKELAENCLKLSYPNFIKYVRKGDFLIGGINFGIGSSREQAAEVLKFLGIEAVIALSFGGIFYRNAINLGLPVILAKNLDLVYDGALASLNTRAEELLIEKSKIVVPLEPIPDNLKIILSDGGLVPHLKKKLKSSGSEDKLIC